jgi:hypothetical protein
MRQITDSPTTPHMPKRSTCGFVIAKPLCARQVKNLPHTSGKQIVPQVSGEMNGHEATAFMLFADPR